MSAGRWGAVGPSEPPAAAPSPRHRNLFSFSLFSPPLAAGRPRGLSAIPAALSALALGALFLFAAAPAAAQGSVAMDRAALVALYNATGGATWTNNTNWLSAMALSQWHGVSTDANGRVTDLYLTDHNLSGEIPAELGDLTNLQNLYLWQNNLSGEIPAALGDLTNLLILFLEDNNLSGEIPAELGDLTSLQSLYLAQNGLSGEIPAELGDLTSLLTLDIQNNNLSGEIPAELGDLTSLQNLFLRDNNLSGEIPAELGDLTNLQNLFLRNNNLSGEIPAELGDLTSLLTLDLQNNNLSGEIPAELGDLTSLQNLYLAQNKLSGEIPAELGDLTSLQYLYLWGTDLSGEIPAELGGLTSLLVLDLARNNLSGEIPAELGDLTNLWSLFLWGNKLSGEIPTELGDLTNLETLYLNQNELSGEIPTELGDLTNLLKLDLSQNELSGEIPTELGNLTSLQRLYLWGNELTGTIPTELGGMTSLQQLSLSENGLTGTIPTELGGLTSLQQLSLSENGLTGAIPTELADLANLQELYLNGNADLTGPLPLGLMNLNDLTTVWIQDTGLCAPEDAAFRTWAAAIADFKGCGGPPPPRPPPSRPPPPPRPDAPTNLLLEVGDGQVTLTWDAPEDDGGSEITGYEYRINGRGRWISTGSTDTTHTITGLDNDTEYTFEVRAVNRIGRNGASSDPVEATPRAAAALDFAHFANGGGTTSEFVFLNVSPHMTRPALYFYDQEGALIDPESVVDVTVDMEVTEDGSLTVLTAMEPLGQLMIRTHGRDELLSGSVKVVSGVPLGGLVRYSVPSVGVAAVGAGTPVWDVLFPARRQQGGIRTAAALHNLQEEAIGVNCRLMSGGVTLEEVEISLEANGQTSWYIEEAFTTTDTSDFLGSVRCTAPASSRFTAIAVETDAAQRIFTTLPVAPVDRTGGSGGETVLDFAHFANGTWITDLVFLNLSIQPSGPPFSPFHAPILPSRPAIYFYDTEGALLPPASVVDLTDDLEVTADGALTIRSEMEPLGVFTISTHGRGELLTGSVKVVSEGPIGGMLRFDHPSLGVAGVETSQHLSDAIFPVRRQEGGTTTGIALHNLESSSGLLRCELLQEGLLRDSVSIPLKINGQTSWLIDAAFPATDTSDFAGTVRCSATGGDLFSAVALEMDTGNRTFTALPVAPLPEMPSPE